MRRLSAAAPVQAVEAVEAAAVAHHPRLRLRRSRTCLGQTLAHVVAREQQFLHRHKAAHVVGMVPVRRFVHVQDHEQDVPEARQRDHDDG